MATTKKPSAQRTTTKIPRSTKAKPKPAPAAPTKKLSQIAAALVSMEDLALLEHIEDEQDIKAARKALKEKGGIPLEDIKSRLGMQ